MPRAVAITKLDHPRADYAATLAAAQQAFGDKVLPLYLPAGGTLYRTARTLSHKPITRTQPASAPRPPRLLRTLDRIDDHRGALIEAIIEESEDESLMERYLGGEQIDQAVIIEDLEKAVCPRVVLPGAAGLLDQRGRNPGIAGSERAADSPARSNTHCPRRSPRRAHPGRH